MAATTINKNMFSSLESTAPDSWDDVGTVKVEPMSVETVEETKQTKQTKQALNLTCLPLVHRSLPLHPERKRTLHPDCDQFLLSYIHSSLF